MSETTFTFRVDEALKQQFAQVAKGHDRSGAQLLREFMRDYVLSQQQAAEYDAWFRQQVQAGITAANAGELTPASEVEARFAARRLATRSRINTGK